MNAIRQFFVTPLGPFVQLVAKRDDPIPLRQIVIAMMRVFYDCKVPDTLARWMGRAEANHRLEERAEHAQVWNELTELLDQMVDLLGGEPVSPADFVEILESGLERFDLALTPPTVDQILVGSVDRTRTGRNVRATIVLGLNEGGFPRCPAESTIFRDSERRELAARDVDLDPDTHRRLFDERFFGYVAFTRASQRLCPPHLRRRRAPAGGVVVLEAGARDLPDDRTRAGSARRPPPTRLHRNAPPARHVALALGTPR